MTDLDYDDPETGVRYRVRESTIIDLGYRDAVHVRAVSRQEPDGPEVVDPEDVRIEVDRLVGRLPGDRCFYRCICPQGVHRFEDDDDES